LLIPCRVEPPGTLIASAASRGAKINLGVPSSVGEAHDTVALRSFLATHPLKESKDELVEVAKIVGADDDDIYIGARATEAALKGASDSGKLASYRTIYFATHGYLAGSFNESEPALALTVPDEPTEFDDGLLTASEIAQLTLDADWVVLSACDTASANGAGSEGLSGLARAFFHAGARALLVSNWSLDDISAREILRATFAALGPDRGKSQALRQAMLSQITAAGRGEKLWDAYPGRWAALEVVGAD
jgi:CHAT domain-containing protein